MMSDLITALNGARGRNRMNTRRDVIIAFAAGAFLSPRISFAQQEKRGVRRIGLLTRKTDASVSSQLDAFREGLRDLGWVEGRSISIETQRVNSTVSLCLPPSLLVSMWMSSSQ
jgi:hypothetical protein